MPLLEVRGLTRRFGGLVALSDVSFAVQPGQIKAVIGPNGAGKTTLFNIISGLVPPSSGEIHFEGRRVSRLKPHRIAELGVSRTFQTPSLFARMSVLENVMVGRHCRTRCGVIGSALRLPAGRREEAAIRAAARERLDFVGLAATADLEVGSLSFGQRRMVELARALATEPKLLMLDEPASGLNSKETEDLAGLIGRLRGAGVTVLLVEHDMSLVMDVSDEIVVLHFGSPIAEGRPEAVRADPNVIAVYLGGEFNGA